MTIAGELYALAERCEQATGPDAYLDLDIHRAVGDPQAELGDARDYTLSLDAAMTLVPEWWDWNAGTSSVPDFPPAEASVYPQDQPFPIELDICVEAATPALALCAAALKARASVSDTHPKDGDVKQAPLVSGAVPEGQTPELTKQPNTNTSS